MNADNKTLGLHITRITEHGTMLHVFYPAGTQPDDHDNIFPNSAWGKCLEYVEVPKHATLAYDGAYEW